jgi:hypothetical protein
VQVSIRLPGSGKSPLKLPSNIRIAQVIKAFPLSSRVSERAGEECFRPLKDF